jgi:hypothetical protein
MAHQLGQIVFLPLPANRQGLDRKISGEEAQQIPHATILTSVRQSDAVPRMPFKQMRHVPMRKFGFLQ